MKFALKKILNTYIVKPRVNLKGVGNKVSISPKVYSRKLRINVNGNNNTVVIDDGAFLHYTKINIGFPDCPIDNCYVHIGKNTRINGAFIQLGEQESEITIGENCLISQ